jgi:hypothetical protein
MGADISMFAEVRGEDKQWRPVDVETGLPELKEIEIDRNYALFGALAGVRRPQGCVTIPTPRGLPVNASWQVREEAGFDGHSYSYLYLRELIAYDWGTQITDDFCMTVLPKLSKLMEAGYSIDEIRILFWFDC